MILDLGLLELQGRFLVLQIADFCAKLIELPIPYFNRIGSFGFGEVFGGRRRVCRLRSFGGRGCCRSSGTRLGCRRRRPAFLDHDGGVQLGLPFALLSSGVGNRIAPVPLP